MKKPEKEESLLDVLESTLYTTKDYQQIVADGAAIERLRVNDDFKRYQRLMAEAYLVLIERIRLGDPTTLPALQGALIQHSAMMKLPSKILDSAIKMVESQRRDREDSAHV